MVCQREMKFRAIAIVDALAFGLGTAVSMIYAVMGGGPWALVAGYLVEEGLSSLLYLRLSPPRPSLRIDGKHLRELMTFGGGQTVAQIAGLLATYGDNFVVGGALGARALGYYTRAYELIKFPSMVFATIVGNVLFPAYSKLQDDRARLAISFRRVTFVNALVLLPATAMIVVLAPEAIRLLVGEGWDSAVLPFQILALSMLLRTNQKLGSIVTQAAGGSTQVALAYLGYMVCVIAGALVAIRWDIVGVATSTALSIVVVGVWCTGLGMRTSGLALGAVLRAHVPGLLLAALVTAVTGPTAAALRAAHLPSAVVFAASALVAVTAALAVALLWLRRRQGDFAWLADEVARVRRRRHRSRPLALG
jgi:PST family polysaccharide transporter